MRALACAALLGLCAADPLHANPDHAFRVAALTRQLELAPRDARLYLRRAQLHRTGGDFERAYVDLETAQRLAPELAGLELATGQLWLDAGRPERAVAALDPLLAREPGHVDALVLRGRARAALGEARVAAADLGAALARTDAPTPELYLEVVALKRGAGEAGIAAALASLDDGIARLGPIYTLLSVAIELEVEREHYAAALARSERLPEALLRQPAWQVRRGDWLAALGREELAAAAYRAARSALYPVVGARPPAVDQAAALLRRIDAALASR